MICIAHQILFGDKIEDEEVVGACGGVEKCTQNFDEET